ncbi:30S ribosomal protein S8 [Candidatus Liberibacter solanacearum]|uniref:Small ribosomal subunit protein uS8 n=1 Tax=Candidatus Liberibacter solanacearum TaxID=556287 RepID=A0A094Z121_9HYPH|nr:30S ribosomal protein S8 [Candidatus Liberibacter solanacearum]KGB27307.1 30S ribosomal protein S8 [Candidatus Liberibacter solanacearum]KJZ81831.1 SSU ribosomal protein S8p (S15Ae) [Candidatus Liberibacter solanacearum]KQC48885.1 30S ribosomal protein S8 [Candidatus Liberibacter solanacearum]
MSCLGDMLTRIRNANLRRKPSVAIPFSRLHASVLDVLQEEGYIKTYRRVDVGKDRIQLEVDLKYHDGVSVIREINCVSKPGRRFYASSKEIPQVYNGLGIMIVTTSKGVMADHRAREYRVGGEVLCSVF